MKKRIFIILALTLIGLVIIYLTTKPKVELWTYQELPNNYIIEKISETEMILGKNINGKIVTEVENKQIGVAEYIEQFSYGENYIALKCLKSNKEAGSVDVIFYIIDTKNEEIYGPYDLESTYETVKEKIVDEELGNWIKTITINNSK